MTTRADIPHIDPYETSLILCKSSEECASNTRILEEVFDLARYDETLAAQLQIILDASEKQMTKLAARVVATLKRVRVKVIELYNDGVVHILPVFVPKTSDHVAAYALSLLLDYELSYGRDLRRCKLAGCGRYFLVRYPHKGRPANRYCCTRHMEQAQARTLSERVMASRLGIPVSRFRTLRDTDSKKLAMLREQKRYRKAIEAIERPSSRELDR